MKNKKEIAELKSKFVNTWGAESPTIQKAMLDDLDKLLMKIIPSSKEAAEIAAERTGVVKAPDAAYYAFQRGINLVRNLLIS